MTAELQMIDPALDRALSASRDPVMPADLTTRIAAQAVAQPQRRISGPFQAWRTRRTNKSRRTRRPVVFGVIGGGLMAASAVAAAWVSDGTFEIARITKPVVELFMPEPPQQAAATPAAPTASRNPVVADRPANADAPRQRVTWIDRPFVRAALIRQRIERIRVRRAEAGITPVVNRPLERRIIQRSGLQSGSRLTETQRTRIRERVQSMPPEQRQQRIQEIRQRRATTPPAVRERAIETRRARIQERMRERGANPPPPASPSISRPIEAPPTGAPSVDALPTVTPTPEAPVTRGSIAVQDSGPGPEPMQMPEARPNLPAADTPATTSARRAAIQARIRAARIADRARAARRNQQQRPPRPRIPRPRR